MSLTVSIGRNLPNGGQLQEDAWQGFTADIVRNLKSNCGMIYFVGFGTGIYNGEEEESFTVIAENPSFTAMAAIRVSLSLLANAYGQEAVSMTEGETKFVYARH